METFKTHLNKFINVNDEELASIFSFFQIKEVQKIAVEKCRLKRFIGRK